MLLEVVIGFGVFATAVLFLFGLFATSKKAQASSKNLAIASELCREAMERELAKGYAGITTEPPIPNPHAPPMESTVNGVTSKTYFQLSVDVNELLVTADSVPRKLVTVTVSWDGVTGPRKVELETILVD
ncbi:MAG TPA: hypothetical protein EYO33_19655 [Phycisphaerales bacterium]|nr:hypothetical protein [Phycisphaerales bacterium]